MSRIHAASAACRWWPECELAYLWLKSCYDLLRLGCDGCSSHKLHQLDDFLQVGDLFVFVVVVLCAELGATEKTSFNAAVTICHSRLLAGFGDDVEEVLERGLAQQLLGHFWLFDQATE